VGGAAALYLPLQLVTVGWERCGQAWGWPPTEQPAVELFMQTHDPTKLIGLFLFAVVLAPLGEEILFRGFLQPWLKSRLNGSLALISTAILFAGIHGHAPTFLPLLVLGLVLGLVYEYTGSWWRCVGLHAGFNAMTAGLILLLKSYQS
jgi:membrane protease YdiL (CAAX protease family)